MRLAWRSAGLRLVVSLCLVAAAACREDARRPTRLLDGSAVSRSVALDGIGGVTVVTRVDVAAAALLRGSAGLACLERIGPDARPARVVTRVGVDGASVTFRTRSGGVYACDTTGGVRGRRSGWCGTAHGRVERGRLADPRLDLVCTNADEEPVAFAWIAPAPNAGFVAVEQPGFVEVYEVAAGMPVRVTTTHVDVAASTASFEVSEHDRRGSLLGRYTLEARVAG